LKGLNETDSSSSQNVQEISERAEEVEDENEDLRNRLEEKENRVQELREERDRLQEDYEALEEKFESRLQGLNSLRSAFQQLGLASEGEVTVEDGVSESDVESIVDEKLSEVDTGSTGGSVSGIEDLVLSDFQEDAVDSLMDEVEDLSQRQRKLLLFIEAKGKNLSSKKDWANGALGFVNGDAYDDMSDLEDRGFVEKKANGSVKPVTEQKVRDELSPYDPEDSDVEDVKKQLLQKVKEGSDTE
jgi:sugar-specific transcriptional regulator TrmB